MDKVFTRDVQNLSHEELLDENRFLQKQLKDLLQHAHRNQRIMSRHQAFDLKLIGSSSFRELLENLFSTLAKTSDLDIVTLTLIDPQHNLRRILRDLNIDAMAFPDLLFVAHENELALAGNPLKKPRLGNYDPALHDAMFAHYPGKPKSVAIVPLIRRKKLIGSINLGSNHVPRFSANMATDFIEHMASIIAICLENVVNNEHLTYIGLTDPLTDVSNRRHTDLKLMEETGRARRQQYSIACMYLDIDHFKQINDTYGHQGGDEALREVAARIKAELRLSDTLGRFGGEEFVVLLINAELADAMHVAERIRASIAAKAFEFSSGQECKASISIGLSTVSPEQNLGKYEDVVNGMLKRADKALYQAKQQGRNQVCSL
jgi:two-component system cell cycle response regulator